jgi:hypothetical protein
MGARIAESGKTCLRAASRSSGQGCIVHAGGG